MRTEEWDLNERETGQLRAVLRDNERVELVVWPHSSMGFGKALGSVFPGLALALFLGCGAYMFGEKWWVVVSLFSPFWLVALLLLSAPLRYRWRMQRTLYVLTNQRAIVFEQLHMWRYRCICWPLFPGLVKKVVQEGPNLGSLIFDYEMRFSFESRRRRWEPQPVGFLMVPQPEQVAQLVAEQVAAVPPEEAPFAYRPPLLRSPAPKLDAWGTPLAEQPGDKQEDRRFLTIFSSVFILLGFVGLGQGVCYLHTESRLETEGVHATATVVKMRSSGGGGRGHSASYYPTLRFTDAAGCEHTLDYPIRTNKYPKGHKLDVVYLAAEPNTLRIVESGMSSGWVSVLGGVLFAAVGCGVLCVGMRMRKKS